MFLFKIKHYSCLTHYVKLFFHVANSTVFYSNVLLFLRRRCYESHNAWICSCKLPPSPACLCIQNLRHWSWERCWPREDGAGAHLTVVLSFFLSFFVLVSLLCSLILLKTQLILPTPSQWQPSFFTWASCLSTPFIPLRLPPPQFMLHISSLIFLFFVLQTKLTNQLYPMHQDFQKSNLYVGEGERSRTRYCLHVSKQQSDHKCQNRKVTAGPGQTKLKKPQPKARQGHQSVHYVLAYNGHLHRPEKSTILTKHCFQRENRKHPRILVQERHININTGI